MFCLCTRADLTVACFSYAWVWSNHNIFACGKSTSDTNCNIFPLSCYRDNTKKISKKKKSSHGLVYKVMLKFSTSQLMCCTWIINLLSTFSRFLFFHSVLQFWCRAARLLYVDLSGSSDCTLSKVCPDWWWETHVLLLSDLPRGSSPPSFSYYSQLLLFPPQLLLPPFVLHCYLLLTLSSSSSSRSGYLEPSTFPSLHLFILMFFFPLICTIHFFLRVFPPLVTLKQALLQQFFPLMLY